MGKILANRGIPYLFPQGVSDNYPKSTKIAAFLRLFFVPFLGVIMLVTPLLGSSLFTNQVSALTDTTGYPFRPGGEGVPIPKYDKDGNVDYYIDPWGFVIKNCTSYAAYRVNLDKNVPYSKVLPAGVSYPMYNTMAGTGENRLSNAHRWDNVVNNPDSPVPWVYADKVPAIGAIAVWDVSASSPVGHVAYVEKVNADGTVDISEYNYGTNALAYGTRKNRTADHYVHFNSSNDGLVGPLSGMIYNQDGTINFNQTLVTVTVRSTHSNNLDFYYVRSYLGAYRFDRLPSGAWDGSSTTITIRATDGKNWTTISGVEIMPEIDGLIIPHTIKNIVLDNECHKNSNTTANYSPGDDSFCGRIPFILPAWWGGYNMFGVKPVTSFGIGGGYIYEAPVLCTEAPTTSVTIDGQTPGNNGWWRSNVNVSFNAIAPCGDEGLKTYYTINDGSQQEYTGPFQISQEGIFNISYYSVDGLGNTESSKSVEVKIDWTPPVTTGTATGPRDINGIFRDSVTTGLNATDNLSGVEKQAYTVDGGSNWTTQNGNNNTFVITGNGVSRFLFRSEDKAGNIEEPKDSGPIIINMYVVFSDGNFDSLRFTKSTGLNILGAIHSNGTASFTSNTGSSIGTTFSTVGVNNLFASSNTNVIVPSISINADSVPMLSYPISFYKPMARVVFPSSLFMDSVGSTLSGIVYVEGDVRMRDVALSGPLSIVATGTITDETTNSTFVSGDPNNGVLLYAGNDVIVKSTGNRNLGLMYAPNGKVSVLATNLTLKGSLVGKIVEIDKTTTLNLSYDAGFAQSTHTLPLSAMGLVEPATPTVTELASVPTLSKPNNASTGISNTSPKLSWVASSQAVGYQVQLSTSATFDSISFDGSYLSNNANPALSKSTKYFWRVRSINEAGFSSWSTVRSFTTK